MSPVTVGLVDDQALIRMGFRMILEAEADLVVVGEAADGQAAVQLARRHQPDVMLMDVRMPLLDGIQATQAIRDLHGPTRILILTTFDLDEYVHAGLRAGASGFLLKDSEPEHLIAAVRTIAAGEAVLAPSATRRLLDNFAPMLDTVDPRRREKVLAPLTARERDVLVCIATGMSNREIAARLFLSEGTVKVHVSRILGKLELRDRVHAVVLAYDIGLAIPDHARE